MRSSPPQENVVASPSIRIPSGDGLPRDVGSPSQSPTMRQPIGDASPLLREQAQRLATANMEVLLEARQLAKELAGRTMVKKQFAQMSKDIEERRTTLQERNRSRTETDTPQRSASNDQVAANGISSATAALADVRNSMEKVKAGRLATRGAAPNIVAARDLTVDMALASQEPPRKINAADKASIDRSPLDDAKVPLLQNAGKVVDPPMSARRCVFRILEGDDTSGQCFLTAFFLLIAVNFISFALSTEPDLQDEYHQSWFSQIETVSVYMFTCEYLLRLWTSVELSPELCKSSSAETQLRLRYALTNFFAVIDVVSILPFYVDSWSDDISLPNTQWLRVVRVLRALPPLEYGQIWSKSKPLLFAGGFAGFTVWVVCASLYYMLEKDNPLMLYCPTDDKTNCWSHFHSIPAAMYFSLLNFFGEFPLISNHSSGGRFVGMFIQVIGAAVMAIPAGALGNAFSDVIDGDDDDDAEDGDKDGDKDDDDGEGGGEEQGDEAKDLEDGQPGSASKVDAGSPETPKDAPQAWVCCLNGEVGVRTLQFPFGPMDAGDVCRLGICCSCCASVLHFVLTSLTHYPGNLNETVAILAVAHWLTTVILSAEFIVRLWASALGGRAELTGYLFSWSGVLDFQTAVTPGVAAIYPIPWLRVFNALRILKLERYVGAFRTFWSILMDSASAFTVTGVFALVCWLICSTLMYFVERNNPDEDMRKYYTSVFTSMWMTLLNLTGEAPLCDYTVPGKFITAFMGLVGVGFVSIPMGLLGGGFQDMLDDQVEEELEDAGEDPTIAKVEQTINEPRGAVELEDGRDLSGRQRVYKFLEGSAENQVDDEDPWEYRAVRFEQLVFLAIFLSAIQATLETVPGLIPTTGPAYYASFVFEISIVLLFSLEYGLRYYTAPENPVWKEKGYVSDAACRFAHMTTWMVLIDLIAIAPFYVSMCGSDLANEYTGQLRMLRIFRLLTLDKYIPSVSLIGGVIRTAWQQFMLAGYAMVALWIIFASLLWLTERHDKTKVDDLYQSQRYTSVVSALPYTLVHLTGDYPLVDYTLPSKIVLFFSLLFAVGVVAVPAGLMASGFSKQLEIFRAQERAKAKASHSKLGNFLKGWIYRRRLAKAFKCALEQSREADKSKALNEKERNLKWLTNRFLERQTWAGQIWSRVMLILIVLNVLAVIGETMQSVENFVPQQFWDSFELVGVVAFTGMYLAHIFAAPVNPNFNGHKWGNRWAFIKSFWGILDLITIAPWWMQQGFAVFGMEPEWLTHAFIFRVVRILRLLQIPDFRSSFTMLSDAWQCCRDSMVAAGFMALLVWVIGSVLFYNFERDNPRMEGAFSTLPSSMYYSLIFLGGEWGKIDFTPAGQVVVVIYCVMGIGLYGIPVGAVFEAFSNVLAEAEAKKARAAGNGHEEDGS